MSVSVIIWLCVAAFLLGVILMRVADDSKKSVRNHSKNNSHKLKFFELGKEREEFFIAGDPTAKTLQNDYDGFDY